jgi:hypothetical protein
MLVNPLYKKHACAQATLGRRGHVTVRHGIEKMRFEACSQVKISVFDCRLVLLLLVNVLVAVRLMVMMSIFI